MHLGTRSLTLMIDEVPRTADVSDCRIVTEERPAGLRPIYTSRWQYRLQCTAAQDLTAGSLWDLLWSRENQDVEVDLRPAGGDFPTPEQPWFTGIVTITGSEGDLIGGQANASPRSRFTFAIDWPFRAKPERIDH